MSLLNVKSFWRVKIELVIKMSEEMKMGSLLEAVQRLSEFKAEGYMVSNLYLKLEPEDRQGGKFLILYKDMVKEEKADLAKRSLSKEVLGSVNEDFERIERFLSEPKNLESCRGVAVFSCSAKGMFEVIKLPYVYRNRLMVAPDPLIREVAAIDEEFGSVAVLLVDRRHARYFIMGIESIEETIDMFQPLHTRAHKFHSGGRALKGAQGTFKVSMPSRKASPNMIQHSFGEYRFNMRIKSEWHAILKLASDALFEDWKERKFDKLVVGGFVEEGLRDIENHLHSYLRDRLIGYININPKEATPAQVREKVLDLLKEKDREEERQLYRELEELEGKGLAVKGVEKVLQVLAYGNIRTLLVAEDYEREGYLCPESHLPTLEPECPLEGESALPVSDVVDEVMEEALEQRAKVEVVIDPEVQKSIEGMSAILRFKV